MNAPVEPWMDCECDEGYCVLRGNREAYHLLKDAIEELLQTGGPSVSVPGKEVDIGELEIQEHRNLQLKPMTRREKILNAIIVTAVLSIPLVILLLAFFGLTRLIQLLF